MKALNIAIVAHCRFPISAPFKGGMESHTYHLALELQKKGHNVVLYAAGTSIIDVPVYSVVADHYELHYPWHKYRGTEILNKHLDTAYFKALRHIANSDFDIIHNNSLHWSPPTFAKQRRTPMLTSLHVPAFQLLKNALHKGLAPWSLISACSQAHLDSYQFGKNINLTQIVPNGIDITHWQYANTAPLQLIWAGRITPNKGTHIAIAAAHKLGLPLALYGGIEDAEYFNAEIKPHLSKTITYHGLVDSHVLNAAFAQSACLLFTPQWDEPFGLTAIEAMACGTPIAAINRGGVKEVVGESGAYCDNNGETLANAVLSAIQIPRIVPRKRVELLYTVTKMIERYESQYNMAISGLRETPETHQKTLRLSA